MQQKVLIKSLKGHIGLIKLKNIGESIKNT